MKQISTSFRALWRRVAAFSRGTGSYALRHKFQAGIAIVAFAGLAYWAYGAWVASNAPAQYALAAVTTGAIEETVTGSGQVASQHELSLAAKKSGEVTGVYVKAGDTVSAGQIIARIDSTDAQKALRDAAVSLESARISYRQAVASANDTAGTSKTSAFNAVASAETDFPAIVNGLRSTFYDSNEASAYVSLIKDNEPTAETARDRMRASYDAAQAAYDATYRLYQSTSANSSPEELAALLSSAAQTSVLINQATKDAYAFLNLVNDTVIAHNNLKSPANLAAELTSVAGYQSKAQSAVTSIASAKTGYENATASLSGSSTTLSLQSAEINYQKAQNSYQDAKDALADYVVTAPFGGTIAKVSVQKYDQASGSVATLITTDEYAELSLNETDAAAVKVGQPVTLTFDAIDGLAMTGKIAEADSVGTVSSGVVSYAVKISFDTQDDRIRPGMTVNATIVTASKSAATLVPSTAVKSQSVNGTTQYYVMVATGGSTDETAGMPGPARTASSTRRFASSTAAFGARGSRTETVDATSVTVTRVPVTIGLQSDTMTEIVTGANAGDRVVTQTTTKSGSTSTTSSQNKGLFGMFGGTANRAAATGGARATSGGNATFRRVEVGGPSGGG